MGQVGVTREARQEQPAGVASHLQSLAQNAGTTPHAHWAEHTPGRRATCFFLPFRGGVWGWEGQGTPGPSAAAEVGVPPRSPRPSHPEPVEVCGRLTPPVLPTPKHPQAGSSGPALAQPQDRLLSSVAAAGGWPAPWWQTASAWLCFPPLRFHPTPPLQGQTLKTLLLCPLIKGSFYPTPDFFLLRLFNCVEANDRPLSGEPHSETTAVLQAGPLPGPFLPWPLPGRPLGWIKLAPASCHLQPIKATPGRRVPVLWVEGDSSLKNLIVSQGYSWFLFLSFHLKEKNKKEFPLVRAQLLSSLMKASQILSQEIRLNKANQLV